MAAPDAPLLASVFGILGNIVSMVLLAPLPTFYRIFKKKSTEGFQSIPYAVALFSAMLMLYYAFVKGHAFMLITINSIACVIETSYLVIYMVYAPAKIRAPNILGFGFGIAQMIMYLVFKNSKKAVLPQYIIKEIPNGNGVAENDNQLKEEDTNGSKVEDARSESMTSKFEDALLGSMTSKFEDATTEPNESVV